MSTSLAGLETRTTALERFGYTTLEASFLCLAALHGGYFLRRQAVQFLGCRDGATVTRLAHRALDLEHARASTWRQNKQLYHLCARPFYEALGEPDNRNRRPHEWTQIKNRIMGLDFVLAHQDVRYLATEHEKLDYFSGTLKINRAKLPSKVYESASGTDTTKRYFLDKYPLFVTRTAPNEEPGRLSFCFVDEGTVSLSRFESYLANYRSLFHSLSGFELMYVAATVAHFAGARAMFERFRVHDTGRSACDCRGEAEQRLTYFRLRRLYEQRQFEAFDRLQLIQLRNARAVFSSAENDALYLTWQAVGDDGLRERLSGQTVVPATIQGTFSTELLTHDYGLFGNTWPR